VLGAAYKKDVDDVRESPAIDILHLLYSKGAQVRYHDPHVPSLKVDEIMLHSEVDLDTALQTSDCVVIVTDHSSYDWKSIREQAGLVVDTRAALTRE
jgi:UDP-N-acetyl-D-glucosamine dehydrogenase